jgi:hypothetical protein
LVKKISQRSGAAKAAHVTEWVTGRKAGDQDLSSSDSAFSLSLALFSLWMRS